MNSAEVSEGFVLGEIEVVASTVGLVLLWWILVFVKRNAKIFPCFENRSDQIVLVQVQL